MNGRRFARGLREVDRKLLALLRRHAHWAHRVTVGLLFIWFGLLKPLGRPTATSVLADTIWAGDVATMTLVLGWWEVAIGICMIVRRWLRVAVALMALRIPGILLAFLLAPSAMFVEIPFAPTPTGQYLIKDLLLFVAALAMAASLASPHTPEERH